MKREQGLFLGYLLTMSLVACAVEEKGIDLNALSREQRGAHRTTGCNDSNIEGQQVSQVFKDLSRCKEDLQAAHTQVNVQRSRAEQSERQGHSARNEVAQAMQKIHELEDLLSRAQETGERLEALEREFKRAESDLLKSQQQKMIVQQQVRAMQVEYINVSQRAKQIQDEQSRLELELRDERERREGLGRQLVQMRQAYGTNHQELKAEQAAHKKTRDALIDQKGKMDQFHGDVKGARAALTVLQAEAAIREEWAKSEAEELIRGAQVIEKELMTTHDQLRVVHDKLNRQEEVVEDLLQQLAKAQKRDRLSTERIIELNESLNAALNDLAFVKKERNEKADEAKSLYGELESLRKEHHQVIEKFKVAQADNQAIKVMATAQQTAYQYRKAGYEKIMNRIKFGSSILAGLGMATAIAWLIKKYPWQVDCLVELEKLKAQANYIVVTRSEQEQNRKVERIKQRLFSSTSFKLLMKNLEEEAAERLRSAVVAFDDNCFFEKRATQGFVDVKKELDKVIEDLKAYIS